MASSALLLVAILSAILSVVIGQAQVCNLADDGKGWTQETTRYEGTSSSTAAAGKFTALAHNYLICTNEISVPRCMPQCCGPKASRPI